MILSFIKNSCGVCGLGVTSSHTGKLSARNYDGKHSVRDGITENFLSMCNEACKYSLKRLPQIKEKWSQILLC